MKQIGSVKAIKLYRSTMGKNSAYEAISGVIEHQRARLNDVVVHRMKSYNRPAISRAA